MEVNINLKDSKGVLGILAGGGNLPASIVQACKDSGRDFFVLAIEGQATAESMADIPHTWVRMGALSKTFDLLRSAGVEDLVMAGAIRRPPLSSLALDMKAVKILARTGAAILGDDGMIKVLVKELETEGFRVVGVESVVPGLLATVGVYGICAPDVQATRDIKHGIAVAQGQGVRDVGQGAVVYNGAVLAVEEKEGTDAMLSYVTANRAGQKGGVLVKVRKPGQENRVDLPTIGSATVSRAAAAGLQGIAIEAGGALVMDREAVVQAADAAGLFVIGISVPMEEKAKGIRG